MLLTKNAVRNAAKMPDGDDARLALNGALVEADGSTVTTNGHWLFIYRPASAPDDGEFPTVEGVDLSGDAALVPFVLPQDAAVAVLKGFPKAGHARQLPILNHAAVDVTATNANGHAVMATTDLENPVVHRPTKLEGKFPNYENAVPKGEAHFSVRFSVEYLRKIATELKAMGAEHVDMDLRRHTKHAAVNGCKASETPKPIVFRADVSDGTAEVVLMPMNIILSREQGKP